MSLPNLRRFGSVLLATAIALPYSQTVLAETDTINKTVASNVLTDVSSVQEKASAQISSQHFITVKDNKLMDGTKEFRFISFNVPTLLYVEDEMAFTQTNPYGLPTEYELRDLFESIQQLGGGVVRAYTIPVRHTGFPEESVTYVEAPGVFNEEAFKTMDLVIALAAEYDIRLVFPLLNDQEWMGGRPQYAAFRGKNTDDFWTDPQLIADFKLTIDHVVGRVNTITGIPYKDDPTIMAWETGNELSNPPEWAIDIARHIKSIDPNHLVIDGYNAIHYPKDGGSFHLWPNEESLEEPAIDLINTHHYEQDALKLIENLKETLKRVDGRKPLFVGEFGFISTSQMEAVLDYIEKEPDVPGALLWSLRRHHKNGGFYHHTEPYGGGLYRAYHWPGFDDGDAYDERNVLALMRRYGFAVQGKAAPPITVPAPPQMLPWKGSPMLSWRGSAGASGYDVERSSDDNDEWSVVSFNQDDIETPGFALFSDNTATSGKTYCYRTKARNNAGVSEPSNAVCGKVEKKTLVDRARGLSIAFAQTGVSVQSDNYRSYKEAFSRLSGKKGASLTYAVPPGGKLLELRGFAFESDKAPNLTMSISCDGKSFTPIDFKADAFVNKEKNYDYLVPIRYTLKTPNECAQYVKLDFNDEANLTRVELDYR